MIIRENEPSCFKFINGIWILVTGILSGIDKVLTLEMIGLRIESFVTTFVGETSEFIMSGAIGSETTVLHTSANACKLVVFTSGTVIWHTVVAVDVVVVKLMHVLTEGIIGIIGMTTIKTNNLKKIK